MLLVVVRQRATGLTKCLHFDQGLLEVVDNSHPMRTGTLWRLQVETSDQAQTPLKMELF